LSVHPLTFAARRSTRLPAARRLTYTRARTESESRAAAAAHRHACARRDPKPEVFPDVSDEIRRLLINGQETIVRTWTEKVTADRRVNSDERLSYLQLVDHIPQIVEELQDALAEGKIEGRMLIEGREHGRQRWRQGYELKEVVRELTLLRVTLVEFLELYRGALPVRAPEDLTRSFHRINVFMDDEIYRTVEAYLDASRNPQSN
jgi:hypothetical protein